MIYMPPHKSALALWITCPHNFLFGFIFDIHVCCFHLWSFKAYDMSLQVYIFFNFSCSLSGELLPRWFNCSLKAPKWISVIYIFLMIQHFMIYFSYIYIYGHAFRHYHFFFFKIFYCYSITIVCLFSASLHPTPAEPPSLPHLHPSPWFGPCVLLYSLYRPHNPRILLQNLMKILVSAFTPNIHKKMESTLFTQIILEKNTR